MIRFKTRKSSKAKQIWLGLRSSETDRLDSCLCVVCMCDFCVLAWNVWWWRWWWLLVLFAVCVCVQWGCLIGIYISSISIVNFGTITNIFKFIFMLDIANFLVYFIMFLLLNALLLLSRYISRFLNNEYKINIELFSRNENILINSCSYKILINQK